MEKIESIVFTLSRLANASEDETKKIIEKYSTMSEIEIIKDLSILSYRMFSSNEGFLNYALTLIRSINPKKCPPMEEMKSILKNMHSDSIEKDPDLQENHKLVCETLENFTTLFNEAGIDYYVVGALPSFIKTGQELFRRHNNINIMINEDDIDKVKELVEICGYSFQDDRYPTLDRYNEMIQNKPTHIVFAMHPENDINFGFFCFRREKDNSITTREYSHHIENGKVIVEVLENKTTKEASDLRYDDTPTEFMQTSFKTSTVENVYHFKSLRKSSKDISDMKKLEPHINKDKLAAIIENPEEKNAVSNVKKSEVSSGIKRI